MASAESTKMGSLVVPAKAKQAKEADTAVTGDVSSWQGEVRKKQRTGEKKEGRPDKEKKGWIEVQLVDEKGKGIPGVPFEVTDPEDFVHSGTTDDRGIGRVEGIAEGTCKVTFPYLDAEAWEPA
jgi:hypothetical protein